MNHIRTDFFKFAGFNLTSYFDDNETDIGQNRKTIGRLSERLIGFFQRTGIIVVCTVYMMFGRSIGCAAQDQGNRPQGTHQDNTEGKDWIIRLERPERIPGLKINEVIKCLQLRPGDVIADIGAGTGAYTIPFARAVAPTGLALGVDIHQELLDYIDAKAGSENIRNLRTILAKLDDPNLPQNQVDIAFFNDVFHNMNDRQAYLKLLASYLKPTGRIVIIEQEFNDPIAAKWDRPEDRITREQVKTWMDKIGFHLNAEFNIFQAPNNPLGTGMPARWFVVYSR
jgi:predicted methyltransferase